MLPRPLWVEYPEDKSTFTMEDEYLLGSFTYVSLLLNKLLCVTVVFVIGRDLLVKPVTTQGQVTLDVYLPNKDEV